MFKSNIKIAIRHLLKNKQFSAINILGLALGIMACLIIAQYVVFNLSFDTHIPNAKNIYRINHEFYQNGISKGNTASTFAPLTPALMNQQPYVQDFVRFWSINYMNNNIIYKSEKGILTFAEPSVYLADTSVFEVFGLSIITGDKQKFKLPNTMFLSESSAIKYFPNESPLGKKVALSGNFGSTDYEVIGVYENLPENTHMDFGVLLSFSSIKEYDINPNSWTSNNMYSYLKLDENIGIKNVTADIQKLSDKYAGEKFKEKGYGSVLTLMPITDIYMYFDGNSGFKQGIDYKVVYALAIIAFVILIIAWINYLNLTLIKTLERSREIGIRRVFGATNKMAAGLFATESLIIMLISFLIALTLAQITGPILSEITGFKFNVFQYKEITFGLLAMVGMGTLIAGFYPSLMSKTFKTSDLLFGKKLDSSGKMGLRKFLIGFQFFITFILIAVTLTVYRQITFMKSADLGINIDNTIVINAPPADIFSDDEKSTAQNNFKTEIVKQSFVASYTNAGEIPGEGIGWGQSIRLKNRPENENTYVSLLSMGIEFHDFFDIKLLAGRKYQQGDNPFRNGNVVINEKFAEILGFENLEDVINVKLDGFYNELNIVGVVENHHHTSLQNEITPIIYILSSFTEYYFIRTSPYESGSPIQNIAALKNDIKTIEDKWYEIYPNEKFDYFFLNESFNKQYKSDENFGKMFGIFSVLAICIACLGLYGLFSFFLHQKVKEIGIRKVLGAGLSDIILMLTKNYALIIIISFAIAAPVFWKISVSWLDTYSYRIGLDLWLFAVPFLLVILISILSVSVRLIKSVNANPAKSLKYG